VTRHPVVLALAAALIVVGGLWLAFAPAKRQSTVGAAELVSVELAEEEFVEGG
jgi:hypothetical protein